MTIRAIAAAAALAVTALAPAAAFAQDAEAAIKYRQQIMKSVGGHFTAVVMTLKGEVPHAEQMPASAQLLADTAQLALVPFELDTSGADVKTTAKADIWADWEKFEGGIRMMQERTVTLASAAASGDQAAIAQAVQGVGETCKGCHDNFRTK